jgi:hypothetical protein
MEPLECSKNMPFPQIHMSLDTASGWRDIMRFHQLFYFFPASPVKQPIQSLNTHNSPEAKPLPKKESYKMLARTLSSLTHADLDEGFKSATQK